MPTSQILRTVKDFAERFTFLPAFESNVPFLIAMSHILELNSKRQKQRPLRRSGLLTFFSSLVIQECLINFAEIIRSANDLEFNISKKSSHCELFFVFCLSSSHPVVVEFAIAEMACVSSNVRRTFHVPSGVRVQRSISERDVSHPRMVYYFHTPQLC